MRAGELTRLVLININQNKFKTIMTSIGIVVGAATIVMVIAIGKGGQMDVAEQFAGLNAGAIDVTYEYEGGENGSGGGMFGNFFSGVGNMFGTGSGSGSSRSSRRSGSGSGSSSGGSGMPGGGGNSAQGGNSTQGNASQSGNAQEDGESARQRRSSSRNSGEDNAGNEERMMPGDAGDVTQENPEDRRSAMQGNRPGTDLQEEMSEGTGENGDDGGEEADLTDDRMNQEEIILTQGDVDDIELFVPGITGATISYTSRAGVEGAELTEAQTYTVAGVKEAYFSLSNLEPAAGSFFTELDDSSRERVCVLGSSLAKELFGSADAAEGEKLYIADRSYTIIGVLGSSQTVFAGISPDEVIFVPYETGIKYISGSDVNATITVIAEDVDEITEVEENVQSVLSANYDNAEFTFSDAGSKMEAAESSNRILTMLLTAMAAIVFLVGGIGIMNVLFVSVKERTNEIGVLKALGASRKMILSEFLMESAAISFIGGVLGVGLSFGVTPVVRYYGMRVETTPEAYLAALGFAVLTGTIFGFYPAWKASRLVPVDALNAE